MEGAMNSNMFTRRRMMAESLRTGFLCTVDPLITENKNSMKAPAPSPRDCEHCAFFLIVWRKPMVYLCRRFPKYEAKLPTDWCGEHKSGSPTVIGDIHQEGEAQ